MKFEPHLPQLPSVGELLEHPRVKGMVERINRSTVAQRATGFLEELRATVVERAGKFEVPPMGHLADRLVRRLLGEPTAGGPAINATGLVVGHRDLAPPLADAAVHAMLQLAGEYHDCSGNLRKAAEHDLAALTGAEGVLALSSFEAALAIALATTTANREALLAGQLEAVAADIDWRGVAARNGVALRNGVDYAAVASSSSPESKLAALIRSPDAEPWLTTAQGGELSKRAEALLIDVAPWAGVVNPQTHGLSNVETIGDRLVAGADLVAVDGAGLIGGPSCGLLFGRRPLIDAAANHPLARLAAIDPLRAAALRTTAQLYRDDEAGVIFTFPVWQLLSAPAANLQQRAERLAALIAAAPGIASAEAIPGESAWLRRGSMELSGPDWTIAIRRRDGRTTDLTAALAAANRPIVAVQRDDALIIHLRSVFPRWDQHLVAEIERAVA
jgi:L-seryl-tRNA(Ser) seleniumtransferase